MRKLALGLALAASLAAAPGQSGATHCWGPIYMFTGRPTVGWWDGRWFGCNLQWGTGVHLETRYVMPWADSAYVVANLPEGERPIGVIIELGQDPSEQLGEFSLDLQWDVCRCWTTEKFPLPPGVPTFRVSITQAGTT